MKHPLVLVVATSLIILSLLTQCDCYPPKPDRDVIDDDNRPVPSAPDSPPKPIIRDMNASIPRNNLYLIGGDIAVTREQYAIFMESGWEGLMKSEAWDDAARRWPTTIPYEISPDVGK